LEIFHDPEIFDSGVSSDVSCGSFAPAKWEIYYVCPAVGFLSHAVVAFVESAVEMHFWPFSNWSTVRASIMGILDTKIFSWTPPAKWPSSTLIEPGWMPANQPEGWNMMG
jgi:hypothetical protein